MRTHPDPPGLVGRWALTRDIDDRHAGQSLRMLGTLTLGPAGSGTEGDLDWVEEGLLHRSGVAPVAVSRRLRVVRRDAGWWVLFEDGRDFHPWRPGAWVEHPCGPDLYRGLVGVVDDDWRVTWEVSGPAKDYTMTSTLRRPTQQLVE